MSGLKLVNSSPANGENSSGSSNVLVKLYFDKDIQNAAEQADKITFKKDSDGTDVDFRVIENSKDLTNINLLVDKGDITSYDNNNLEASTAYTITVADDFTAADGSTLGADGVVSFSTMEADSGFTYMLLMIAMIVVMVVMSVRDQRKKARAEADIDPMASVPTNPYKLAKEKNISVAEAQKIIEKARAKAVKRAEELKTAPVSGSQEQKKQDTPETGSPAKHIYRVKSRRSAGRYKR